MGYQLHPPRPFIPYQDYRRMILTELRRKQQRRRKLEEFFSRAFSAVMPKPRLQPGTSGFHQTIIKLQKPEIPKKRFRQLLYELKRDGLAETSPKDNDTMIDITAKGLGWLKKFKEKSRLAVAPYNKEIEKSDRVTIISYDIPEKIKEYRRWLRAVLRRMKFGKIHQSVWIGKVKLPADFIADLTRYKLENYVEIFEITRTGTLRHRL